MSNSADEAESLASRPVEPSPLVSRIEELHPPHSWTAENHWEPLQVNRCERYDRCANDANVICYSYVMLMFVSVMFDGTWWNVWSPRFKPQPSVGGFEILGCPLRTCSSSETVEYFESWIQLARIMLFALDSLDSWTETYWDEVACFRLFSAHWQSLGLLGVKAVISLRCNSSMEFLSERLQGTIWHNEPAQNAIL